MLSSSPSHRGMKRMFMFIYSTKCMYNSLVLFFLLSFFCCLMTICQKSMLGIVFYRKFLRVRNELETHRPSSLRSVAFFWERNFAVHRAQPWCHWKPLFTLSFLFNSTSKWEHLVFIFLFSWLTSPSSTLSSSIQAAANSMISSFFIPLYM